MFQIGAQAPFLGNHGEIFTLANGTTSDVQFEYEYLYEHHPSVIICSQQGFLICNKSACKS